MESFPNISQELLHEQEKNFEKLIHEPGTIIRWESNRNPEEATYIHVAPGGRFDEYEEWAKRTVMHNFKTPYPDKADWSRWYIYSYELNKKLGFLENKDGELERAIRKIPLDYDGFHPIFEFNQPNAELAYEVFDVTYRIDGEYVDIEVSFKANPNELLSKEEQFVEKGWSYDLEDEIRGLRKLSRIPFKFVRRKKLGGATLEDGRPDPRAEIRYFAKALAQIHYLRYLDLVRKDPDISEESAKSKYERALVREGPTVESQARFYSYDEGAVLVHLKGKDVDGKYIFELMPANESGQYQTLAF